MKSHRTKTITIRFLRRPGCPMAVVADMLRYDDATLVGTTTDEHVHEECVRSVTMTMHWMRDPTMARWASFAVGAQIVSEG
jgi:hypothetical protein